MWKKETPEIKATYKAQADAEKEMYRKLYPGYKCVPRKSADIKKRRNAKAQPVEIQGDQPQGHAQLAAAQVPVINQDNNGYNLHENNPAVLANPVLEQQPAQPPARLPPLAAFFQLIHDHPEHHLLPGAGEEVRQRAFMFYNNVPAIAHLEQRRLQREIVRMANQEAAQQAQLQQNMEPLEAVGGNFVAFAKNPFNLDQENYQQVNNEEVIDNNQIALVESQAVEVEPQVVDLAGQYEAPNNGVNENAGGDLDVVLERHARLLRQLQDDFRREIDGMGIAFPVAYAQLEDAAANL